MVDGYIIREIIEKDITIKPAEEYEVIDKREKGAIEFALVYSNSDLLQLLLQLDNQPTPNEFVSIAELLDYGLDERISFHFWVSKYVGPPTNEYVVVLTNNIPEQYKERIRFVLKNPTGTNILLKRIELKRVVC